MLTISMWNPIYIMLKISTLNEEAVSAPGLGGKSFSRVALSPLTAIAPQAPIRLADYGALSGN